MAKMIGAEIRPSLSAPWRPDRVAEAVRGQSAHTRRAVRSRGADCAFPLSARPSAAQPPARCRTRTSSSPGRKAEVQSKRKDSTLNQGRLLGHLLCDLVAHVVHEGRAGRRRSEKPPKAQGQNCCRELLRHMTAPSPRRERCHASHLLDFQVLLYREVQVPARGSGRLPKESRPRRRFRPGPEQLPLSELAIAVPPPAARARDKAGRPAQRRGRRKTGRTEHDAMV